ncbi:OPT/YSL family transporter [Thermoanaerobacterium thermosaccharolyticum]|uniref:OPT/YSL family transporter n=1 Tax=Thermoanaerobacterium thermosaccharolyticum TaxID=1517 RepID=UPI003DA9262B
MINEQNSKQNEKHPSVFEPIPLIFNTAIAVFGAIIGLQLITTLGVSPNTSIIGALIAILVSRIPLKFFKNFRSIHHQNLMQTSISSATFGAANSLMIPIGVPFLIGKPELSMPMLIGATLAMFTDATILYRLFDSDVFPASNAWPPGVATAESIIAADKGGKRAYLLGIGMLLGIIGSYFQISMSAFGIAFIGNIWALTMFGIGLLIRQYSTSLFGIDVNQLYIPHGIMIGAGLVALIQIILIFKNRQKQQVGAETDTIRVTRTSEEMKKTIGFGFLAYIVVASVIALLGGLITKMSFGMVIVFIIFAAIAAYFHELIVGISAMHSGWFPAFAVAFVTLLIGMMIGFPPVALALLIGYSASTGPAFADMGYDLKAGYILRGKGKDPQLELEGRKQQYITALLAFGIAVLVVLFSHQTYFLQNLVPPVDKVYVSTIQAGTSPQVAKQLLIWAIPGAIVQLIGGPSRQIGVLFATGLLILNPNAGWVVLAGVIIRGIVLKIKGKEAEVPMSILAAGFIAGDALYSFFNSMFHMKTIKTK